MTKIYTGGVDIELSAREAGGSGVRCGGDTGVGGAGAVL